MQDSGVHMVEIDKNTNTISYNVDPKTTTLEEICSDNTYLRCNYSKYIENFQYYYNIFLKKFESSLVGFKKMVQLDLGSATEICAKDMSNESIYRFSLKKVNFEFISGNTSTHFRDTWVLLDRKSHFVYSFINNSFGIVCDSDTSHLVVRQISSIADMEEICNILISIDIDGEYKILCEEIKTAIINRNKEITKHSNELHRLASKMKELGV